MFGYYTLEAVSIGLLVKYLYIQRFSSYSNLIMSLIIIRFGLFIVQALVYTWMLVFQEDYEEEEAKPPT